MSDDGDGFPGLFECVLGGLSTRACNLPQIPVTDAIFFPPCPPSDRDSDEEALEAANYISYDSFEVIQGNATTGYDGCAASDDSCTLAFHYSLRDTWTNLSLGSFSSRIAYKQLPFSYASQAWLLSSVFHIGLVLMQWYWMGYCTQRMDVAAGHLDDKQLSFWQNFFEEISGEYFMENKLDWWGRLRLTCSAAPSTHPGDVSICGLPPPDVVPASAPSSSQGSAAPPCVLVPLGAGKDSLTLFEMLKAGGVHTRWFFLSGSLDEYESVWRYSAVARASGDPAVLLAEHEWDVDDKWERARPSGRLRPAGHSWAALVAVTAALAAPHFGCSTICVGNDRSANFGNGLWHGREVNHQYDKGSVFEALLRNYLQRYVVPDVTYCSGLGHLWELQIAERFAHGPAASKYLALFLSCNEPQGARWCARCAKCLFVALIMGAFLPPTQVMGIFGDDILENVELLPILRALLGDGAKPLECIGTPHEVQLALHMAMRQYNKLWPGYCPALLRSLQSDSSGPLAGLTAPASPSYSGSADSAHLPAGGSPRGGRPGANTVERDLFAGLDLSLLRDQGDVSNIPTWLRPVLVDW